MRRSVRPFRPSRGLIRERIRGLGGWKEKRERVGMGERGWAEERGLFDN